MLSQAEFVPCVLNVNYETALSLKVNIISDKIIDIKNKQEYVFARI